METQIPDSLYNINGYGLYRDDRIGHGGGAAIYVKSGISCKFIEKSKVNCLLKYIFVEISTGCNKILVGSIYRKNRDVYYSQLIEFINNNHLNYENIVLTGDFNSNIIKENHLVLNMQSLGLFPVNTVLPTHFSKNVNNTETLLDLFFVNNKMKVKLYDQLSVPNFSKHDLIFLTYDFSVEPTSECFSYYDFKNIDYLKLNDLFAQVNWNIIYSMVDVDLQTTFLQDNIARLFKECVPLKTKRIIDKTRPWFHVGIQNLIEKRDVAYNRWKKYKIPSMHDEFKCLKREVVSSVKNAKSNYYKNKYNNALNIKQTWSTIRKSGIGKQHNSNSNNICPNELNQKFLNINIPNLTTNHYDNFSSTFDSSNSFEFSSIDMYHVFQCFSKNKSTSMGLDDIHPTFVKIILPHILPVITFYFNSILTRSVFPVSWKLAKIIPILKSKNEYRPISILPYFSKVFEIILQHQINVFIDNNKFIFDRQSGFRSKRSCTTALLNVTEDIRKDVDAKKIVFLTLLDHSKAFDTVNHEILLSKLKHIYNFSDTASKLLHSYLLNRSQSVCIGNKVSNTLSVSRGVPQGSILGPLLFILYINDLPSILSTHTVHIYADDVQLYTSCELKNIDSCITTINNDLKNVASWALKNGLVINPNKSKCLIISKKIFSYSNIPKIYLNGQSIDYVDSAKNLGVTFNRTLTWSNHIYSTLGKVNGMLRTLWSTHYFTPPNIRMLLAKTYVIPTLLYGCEIYCNSDAKSRQKLIVTYNNIARYVFGINRRESISAFSFNIFNMPFINLLDSRVLIQLHKIIVFKEPHYLFQNLTFARSPRGRKLLNICHTCRTSEQQFFIYAIQLWNALPLNIQEINNATLFKNKLKAFLKFNSFQKNINRFVSL